MELCGEMQCHNCYTDPILRPTRMLMASRISLLLYLAKLRHELLLTAEPGLTLEQECAWKVFTNTLYWGPAMRAFFEVG